MAIEPKKAEPKKVEAKAPDKPAGDEPKKPKPGEESKVKASDDAADEKPKKSLAEGGDEDDADADDADDAADGGEGEDKDADDWRTLLAGGNEKRLAFYKRFTSPEALDRHIELTEKRVREKGGISPPKPDAPAEEQAKYFTEHHGRPADVEALKAFDFTPKLEEGDELTDEETTLVSGVVGMAYDSGIFGGPQLKALAQMAADLSVGGRKQQEKTVEAFRETTKKELSKEWRGDTDANLNLAIGYTQMRCAQAGVDRAELANVRLANGALLGDHPLFLKVMALGGKEHAEDPLMNRVEGSGARGEELQAALAKEMKKASGTPAERREYDSEAGRARRLKLRTDLKRMGIGGQPPKAKAK